MNNILKFEHSKKPNIYICSYCLALIKSEQFKSLLVNTDANELKLIHNTKCFICDRFINGILKGPDILKFLLVALYDKDEESDYLLRIAKISNWYYHNTIEHFTMYLKTQLKFNHGQIKNIYQAINELYTIPTKDELNQKVTDLIANLSLV